MIEQGSFVAERYRVVERLTRFAVADSALTGVEYEYWLALDETRGVEVWIQVAESREVTASGAHLAGVVSALRRLNHPAVPAVLDFGEIEIEVVAEADLDSGVEDAGFVELVGYVVLEPVEAESLATVLLRGALTEAEIFAALVEIADVLKVLHEVELVHGHLSAYSFLLGERSVLLIDLAAALALETASGSELTAAADVYALAWLACVAVAGVEAVEAEFGVGFDAGSSPESAAAPQLLTLELVERRRAWAELNLIETYGLPVELAQLLVAALGEAAGRPAAGVLATALRRRQGVSESAGAGTAAAVVAGGAAAALAAAGIAEAAQEADVVGVAGVAGAGAEAAAVEEVDVEEIGVEEVEVAQAEEAGGAAAAGLAAAGPTGAAASEAAGLTGSAAVVEEAEVEEVALESSGATGTVGASRAAGALVGAGVGASMGIAAEAMSSGGRGRGGSGGGVATASPASAPPSSPTGSPSGRHGTPPNRPKSATYVAIAIVLAAVGAIVWGCSGGGGSSPAASPTGTSATAGQATGTIPGTGSSGGASATATATAGSGAGPSPSASAGGPASPSSQVTASAGASASAGGGSGSGATPGYTPTPLATAPNSPGEALTQIKRTVSQAESNGQIPQKARGPLSGAINTLQGEIDHGGSVQQGIAELRAALNTPGVPAGFVTQINELIPYLEQVRGS